MTLTLTKMTFILNRPESATVTPKITKKKVLRTKADSKVIIWKSRNSGLRFSVLMSDFSFPTKNSSGLLSIRPKIRIRTRLEKWNSFPIA